jgi:NAD(P)-dependent dehydrogenase (short-subunit alcohol dehydrogenase family)
MTSTPTLTGRRIVITGASRGLGRAFAISSADLGANLTSRRDCGCSSTSWSARSRSSECRDGTEPRRSHLIDSPLGVKLMLDWVDTRKLDITLSMTAHPERS